MPSRSAVTAQTNAGNIPISVPFSVPASLAGIQSLNARPTVVSNVDVNRGFPEYLRILGPFTPTEPRGFRHTDSICSQPMPRSSIPPKLPSSCVWLLTPDRTRLTLRVAQTNDVVFGLQFNSAIIGSVVIGDLLLVPDENVLGTEGKHVSAYMPILPLTRAVVQFVTLRKVPQSPSAKFSWRTSSRVSSRTSQSSAHPTRRPTARCRRRSAASRFRRAFRRSTSSSSPRPRSHSPSTSPTPASLKPRSTCRTRSRHRSTCKASSPTRRISPSSSAGSTSRRSTRSSRPAAAATSPRASCHSS